MEIILYSNKQILGGFVLVILIGLLFASNIMLTNLEEGINMSYFISPIIFTICIISILYIGSLRKSINQTYDKYVLPDNFSIYNCPDGYRKEIEGENVKCQPINGNEQEPTPEEPTPEEQSVPVEEPTPAEQPVSVEESTVVEESGQNEQAISTIIQEAEDSIQIPVVEEDDSNNVPTGISTENITSVSSVINVSSASTDIGTGAGTSTGTGTGTGTDTDTVIENFNQLNNNSCVNVSYMDGNNPITAQQMCNKLDRSVKLDKTCINAKNQYGEARARELCAQGFKEFCFNTNICEDIDACCEKKTNSYNNCNNFKTICGNDKNLSYDNTVANNDCKTLQKLPKGLTTQYGYKYGYNSETGQYEDLVENNNHEDPFEYKYDFITKNKNSSYHNEDLSINRIDREKKCGITDCCYCDSNRVSINGGLECGECPDNYMVGPNKECIKIESNDTPSSEPVVLTPLDESTSNEVEVEVAPVVAPVAAPVVVPVSAPVSAPVAAPVAAPVSAPVAESVAEPVADVNMDKNMITKEASSYRETYNWPKKAFFLNGDNTYCGEDVIRDNGCFNKFPNRVEKCKKIQEFLKEHQEVMNNWTDFQKECQI